MSQEAYQAQKQNTRIAVRSYYDLQKNRIQLGNRIAAAFRAKLGLESSEAEENNENANKVLEQIRAEYDRITDGIKRITVNFKSDSKIISDYGELKLVESYNLMLKSEEQQENYLKFIVKEHPIYPFLLKTKGCGILMAAVIISEIDIHKADSVSALWKYAGLDTVIRENENGDLVGEGRSRKKHHLEAKTYVNRDGEQVETVGITFNPFLKTKLIGVLGSCMIKACGYYADIYRAYKHRLETDARHSDKTKAHRHNMAIRYMVKMFLQDLYSEWRTVEGLDVRVPYHQEKHGHVHH